MSDSGSFHSSTCSLQGCCQDPELSEVSCLEVELVRHDGHDPQLGGSLECSRTLRFSHCLLATLGWLLCRLLSRVMTPLPPLAPNCTNTGLNGCSAAGLASTAPAAHPCPVDICVSLDQLPVHPSSHLLSQLGQRVLAGYSWLDCPPHGPTAPSKAGAPGEGNTHWQWLALTACSLDLHLPGATAPKPWYLTKPTEALGVATHSLQLPMSR